MKAGIKILIGVGAAAAVASTAYLVMKKSGIITPGVSASSGVNQLTDEQINTLRNNAVLAAQSGQLQLKVLTPSQTGDAARQALLDRVGISLEEYAGGKVASYKAAGLTGIENLVL